MKNTVLIAFAWASLYLWSVDTAHAQKYTLTDLGSLGGTYTLPIAISDNGIVVGTSLISGENIEYAFKWQNGVMTNLGGLGGTDSEGTGVNAAGQVVGDFFSEGVEAKAFIYTDGQVVYPYSSAITSSAGAINDKGEVTGSYTDDAGVDHAFIYNNSTFTDLKVLGAGLAINSAGDVAGYGPSITPPYEAFLDTDGVVTDLGVGIAQALNDVGQITGEGNFDCFLSTNGTRIKIGQFRRQDGVCEAAGINNSGTVVGEASIVSPYYIFHAFIYRAGVFSDLNSMLVGPSAPYVVLGSANAINNAGQIVAAGSDSRHPYETHAFLLDPVPPLAVDCPTTIAQVGISYESSAAVTGGISPNIFVIAKGALPDGLDLNASSGLISGTPTEAGSFAFEIQVTEKSANASESATRACSITVAPAGVPALSATPVHLSFGIVTHETFTIKEVSLRNTGALVITLSDPIISPGAGTGIHDFTSIDKCASQLAPGASCFIYVTFVSEQTGSLAATLTVPTSASRQPVVIKLSAFVTSDTPWRSMMQPPVHRNDINALKRSSAC